MPDVDPSAVWIIVGDLGRLPEWTPVESAEWDGDLPQAHDTFTISALIGYRSHTLECVVADWQAGRGYRIDVGGLPFTSGTAVLECRVESVIEAGGPGTEVKLQYAAEVSPWLAGMVRWGAQHRLGAALRKLRRRVA
jgi:hypothetical protein